jgi:N6-L-threonylcarbamoyladenine synthase
LRDRMEKAGAEAGLRVLFPSLDLCTDNGAMIAVAGAWRLSRGERTSLGVAADPSLELG